MNTSVTLYRLAQEKAVPVGTLSGIGFTPGMLPHVMQNIVRGISPAMREEELRHIMTFDCSGRIAILEPHAIEVGDHFVLRVDEFIAMHDSGGGPAHCSAFVSLLHGRLKK
jgi:hypothetical protein